MRIHPVVNVSQVVQYREQIKGQKREEGKPVEVKGVEEWEVERILNKKKIKGVEKYLVWWKEFMAKRDTWERKENLKNAKELVDEFEERISTEIRKQEKVNQKQKRGLDQRAEEFKRMELPGRYTAKILYG